MDIVGNKVLLRAVEEQDRGMLVSLINDPEITKVTGGYSYSSSYEHQINWFRSIPNSVGSLHSIIADRKSPQIALGIIILSPADLNDKSAEIYIKLIKSVRGKGYGQDAVNVLVSYAFRELRLNSIYANILDYNTASRRLFESCGFKQEGIHKSRIDRDGCCRSICIYKIINPSDK